MRIIPWYCWWLQLIAFVQTYHIVLSLLFISWLWLVHVFCVMLQSATITGDATCTSSRACQVSERIHTDHTVVLLVTSLAFVQTYHIVLSLLFISWLWLVHVFCVVLQSATITGDATCTSSLACYVSERIHADHTVVLLVTSIAFVQTYHIVLSLLFISWLWLVHVFVLCYSPLP